jgi:hypothetical protein
MNMETIRKKVLPAAFAVCMLVLAPVVTVLAQEDPLSLDEIPLERLPVKDAFNGSYIINNQSTNVVQPGSLNFLILHRFGEFSDGAFNAFGMDYAAIRFGFEYGLTKKLTAAIGRSSVGKNYDGHLKFRPMVQTTGGVRNNPVSIVMFSSVAFSAIERKKQRYMQPESPFSDQLVYTNQMMVSRQFSPKFACQFSGAMIHRNTVASSSEDHNIFALSAGARLRVSDRIHMIGDYSYVLNNVSSVYNPVAVGFDIVTGGHIFQLYVSNSVGMIEKEFLTATTGNIKDGDIRFGFTVTRAFMLKHDVKGGKIK